MKIGLFEEHANLREINRRQLVRKKHEVVINVGSAADAWIEITDYHKHGGRLEAALVNFDRGPNHADERIAEMIVAVLREKYENAVKIAVVISSGHRNLEPPEADLLLNKPDTNEFLQRLKELSHPNP